MRIPLSREVRNKVIRKYNGRCYKCNNKGTQINHIDKNNDNDSLSNLEWVCDEHHGVWHKGKDFKISEFTEKNKPIKTEFWHDTNAFWKSNRFSVLGI